MVRYVRRKRAHACVTHHHRTPECWSAHRCNATLNTKRVSASLSLYGPLSKRTGWVLLDTAIAAESTRNLANYEPRQPCARWSNFNRERSYTILYYTVHYIFQHTCHTLSCPYSIIIPYSNTSVSYVAVVRLRIFMWGALCVAFT